MRILLTSNATYDPPRGGSTRSNLAWLRLLADAGHECLVVCAADAEDRTTTHGGIRIQAVRELARRTGELQKAIAQFLPDWVLVTSEDVGHTLLREAARAAPGRMVYLAHTPQWFPFGSESWHPDPAAADAVRSARAIVAIGQHMAGYIERSIGVRPAVIHPPIYGRPPYPQFGRPDGCVLMINPSEVKGLRILLALAARFPHMDFAALAGWGTTRSDRERMAALPNVRVLETVPHINDALSQARVLLMPSLWYEGFGLIAMEAMLRGLPVIASDSGGLAEAKAGTGYVVPVRPIQKWLPDFDENGMPRAVVPDQDVEPWAEALRTLMSDGEAWREESERSREAAAKFVAAIEPNGLEPLLSSLRVPPMRVLLAHNSLYFPSHGGGDKSNRILMESLVSYGHDVRVVARIEHFGEDAHQKLLGELAERGVQLESTEGGVVRFRHNGVDVHTLTANPRIRSYFERQIAEFDPDVIITSTDDPAQLLFEIAADAERARLVYLVRATIAAPFGPDASSPNTARTASLRRAGAVATVSEYVARYVREHAGMDAIHVPISLPEPGPYPDLGRHDNPYVTMVNPCAVKGIAIFLELADRMPDVQFAGVPTWGATHEDLAAMRARPNVTVLPPADDIDEILRHTRVLLVPSVWAEARSRIVLEAMERGIPVLAGNLGGLPEAKLGTPYVLPVNPIRRYLPSVDENMVPVADVPPQDVGPWVDALRRLIDDPAHWSEISRLSREVGCDYGSRATARPFEALLGHVVRLPKKKAPAAVPAATALDRLSPERRRLLEIRLRKRVARPVSAFFPGIDSAPADKLRLFCFPHAGGGTAGYAGWRDALTDVYVQPVRLAGRESRAAEPPVDNMTALVAVLADAIAPWIATAPFAFYGHSMGAGIAFELARELRRRDLPPPQALIVSGARTPQLREGWTPPPEPTDDELVEQLARLEGVPAELLDNRAALELALRALRADLRLYRNYAWSPEPPLAVPIIAYAGTDDPNVRPDQVAAWADLTTATFRFREFAGGHFFHQKLVDEFLEAVTADLAAARLLTKLP